MAPSTVLACVVQQPHPDFFPHSVWPIKPKCVGLLNFNDAKAAQTFHAQQVPWDFGQPALLNRKPRLTSGARIGQDRIPLGIWRFIRRRL
jgi:hypothetical protein